MATKTVSQIFATQKLPVSFEIFPPKGDLSQEEAQQVASQLAPLDPAFISVTYSAGGSGNSSRTLEVARLIQRDYDVSTVAHLTCQGLTRQSLAKKSARLKGGHQKCSGAARRPQS